MLHQIRKAGTAKASVKMSGLRAEVVVHDLTPQSLPSLFDQLERDWKGWKGVKRWQALEDQLQLDFRSLRAGVASVEIVMQPDMRKPWRVTATVEIESGQYKRIAASLRNALRVVAA